MRTTLAICLLWILAAREALPGDLEDIVTVAREAPFTVIVKVPPARHPDKLDPAGWYVVACADVIGGPTKRGEKVTLAIHAPDRAKAIASHATALTEGLERPWVRVPAKHFADLAGREVRLEVSVSGDARVGIRGFHLHAFHTAPTRVLLGKANGKNGPDKLASGALGFTALTEHLHTAFSLLSVEKGGPAARAGLRRSDLVVAVDGAPLRPSSLAPGPAWFADSHEAVLGRAVERALTSGDGGVRLTVLRKGGLKELEIRLPLTKGFADTFPFDDALADRLYADVIRWIETHQSPTGRWPGNAEVNSSLAGLALLGTRDRKHKAALKKLADFLLARNPSAEATQGFSFWPIAFQGMFLCEYHLATGDKRALAWIRDAIEWLPEQTHPSTWGMPAFGHSPKGLPYGQKALMAPCAHLLVFEALAVRCGIESGVWTHIEPYVTHSWSDPEKGGHGAMGYNAAAKDKAQFWSRTGLTALALTLQDRRPRMRAALTGIMVERHPWMLNSHAYGEPGAALGLLGLAVADPEGFRTVMPAWRWRFLGAWEPGYGLRYSTAHMGAPYMGEDEIMNPAYGLLLAVRNRGLVMAGGEPERWLARR